MLEQVCRDSEDYLPVFKEYLNGVGKNEDKDILLSLQGFITREEEDKYLSAWDNYFFKDEIINENTEIFANTEKLKIFWNSNKDFPKKVIPDLEYCPVCGISYDDSLDFPKSIEHVLPKSYYNQYVLSPFNLVYYCGGCNSYRGNKLATSVNEEKYRIFHPYLSNINCQGNINFKIFESKDKKIRIKITIDEDNEDYKYFIKKLFSIHKTYTKFLTNILNREVSSIEGAFKKILDREKSKGTTSIDKIALLKSYLSDTYHLDVSRYSKTDTEKILIEKLDAGIKKEPEYFARYIYEKIAASI